MASDRARVVELAGYDTYDPATGQVKQSSGTVSQPFPPPSPGNNVAVKIITRTGAEMTATADLPR